MWEKRKEKWVELFCKFGCLYCEAVGAVCLFFLL